MISLAHHADHCLDQGSPTVCHCQERLSYKDALLRHVSRRFTPDCTVEHISDGRKGKYLGPLIDGTTVYLIIALEDGGSPVQELPGWWRQVRL